MNIRIQDLARKQNISDKEVINIDEEIFKM